MFRQLRPAGAGFLTHPLSHAATFGSENLEPVVAPVGDVDKAFFVNGDPRRTAELAISVTRRAKLHQKPAVRCELLNSVVAPIGHVYITLAIDSNVPRQVELAVAPARSGPFRQEFAILDELLNPVVTAVDQEEIILSVESQMGRRSISPSPSPGVPHLPFHSPPLVKIEIRLSHSSTR